MPKLSIIILSYNTREITSKCLDSLLVSAENLKTLTLEIIVVDNSSSDNSIEMLLKFQKKYHQKSFEFNIIKNNENVGYSRGNNMGVARATGEYVLFLNSDVLIESVQWDAILRYLSANPDVSGYTVRVNLEDSTVDRAAHRGFPTLWNSFCYYSGLETVTKNINFLAKIFGGYHLTYLPLDTTHEIDSPSGAFFLTRKYILSKLHGFDETFFMYGEDIDLALRMKELGGKIIYDPRYIVTHLKYQSGISNPDEKTQKTIKRYFYDAMKIFYTKHYAGHYNPLINSLVYFFINLKSRL